jgi:hypothetical protein
MPTRRSPCGPLLSRDPRRARRHPPSGLSRGRRPLRHSRLRRDDRAVGERYWPILFATIKARLAKGGRAMLQAITLPLVEISLSESAWTSCATPSFRAACCIALPRWRGKRRAWSRSNRAIPLRDTAKAMSGSGGDLSPLVDVAPLNPAGHPRDRQVRRDAGRAEPDRGSCGGPAPRMTPRRPGSRKGGHARNVGPAPPVELYGQIGKRTTLDKPRGSSSTDRQIVAAAIFS